VFVGSLSNCIDPASAFFDLSSDIFIATAVIYFSGRVTYAIVARGTKKIINYSLDIRPKGKCRFGAIKQSSSWKNGVSSGGNGDHLEAWVVWRCCCLSNVVVLLP
jgi:hypothetical protein